MGADQFNIPPAQIFLPPEDKVRCDRKLDNQLELTIREYNDKDLAEVLSAWESASEVAHPFLSQGFLDQERRNILELYLPNADTWVPAVEFRSVSRTYGSADTEIAALDDVTSAVIADN